VLLSRSEPPKKPFLPNAFSAAAAALRMLSSLAIESRRAASNAAAAAAAFAIESARAIESRRAMSALLIES
jgi:hypothetical protein